MNTNAAKSTEVVERRKLSGSYTGFSKLTSKVGVYRCKLWRNTRKKDPTHSDYQGVLHLTGSKASILVWVHEDGSLGLRLEKITERKAVSK